MTAPAPILIWFRRDLRLDDNPLLAAAAATGAPLVLVALPEDPALAMGAAARWRYGEALAAFAKTLEAMGQRLILRRGDAGAALPALAAETGARAVWFARDYAPATIARDASLRETLRRAGVATRVFTGGLLAEPWDLAPAQGGAYRVFTPYWKALRKHGAAAPEPAPARLAAPGSAPAGVQLADFALGRGVGRGGAVLARYARIGEARALNRLAGFCAGALAEYPRARDFPDREGTSALSEPLAHGEIGSRRIWHAVWAAAEAGNPGAEAFLRQLAWRDFAWHLHFHHPGLARDNYRPEWDGFPWRGDGAEAERWRRGATGEPFVDAGLRQMYVTGRMHNRARMVAASYLTKHLLIHWRVGLAWFAECLTDWDPAANALGWQWVAGSGPDAAPFFRIFNPATQAGRHDPSGAYRRAYLAELSAHPPPTARAFFEAAPPA